MCKVVCVAICVRTPTPRCVAAAMPMVVEQVSRRSLDFANQRKAYVLRTVHKQSYQSIATQVVNLQGSHPVWGTIRNAVEQLSRTKGRRTLLYANCGRKSWKLTPAVQSFILKKLLGARSSQVVTSVTLANDVAKKFGVILESSVVRKFLKKKGYKWLRRRQNRKYSGGDRAARLRFARGVARLSKRALRSKLCMSLDGVVLSMPPAADADRFNYCWGGFSHVWRKPGEANSPSLAGGDSYDKQVPISRAIPLWGGLSESGFAPVLWHKAKKVKHDEWLLAVRDGKLSSAIRQLNPGRRRGPWTLLCDNESFLRHRKCMRAYAARNIDLWAVPARSPDLNPIEMYWAWVRRQLRVMDLVDMKQKRPALAKPAYAARVRSLLRSSRSQRVAAQCAKNLRKVCLQVIRNKGAAAGN